ncbi:DUF551 domain-containing protein [Raoultella planticola]|uniref:DUF551 domain-containing protein n=1 Tax=Raoultella planticola TaxID=575 RepID=UPI0038139354
MTITLQAVNKLIQSLELATNRSREHFISLCNEFWNWSEMDLVCADDRGYELRMEWDGKVFNHPVTQALWRMYQAAPTGIPIISDRWIPVSERMPEKADEVLCAKEFDGPGDWRQKVGYYLAGKWTVYGASWTPTHWMPLPAAPQEVNGE